jgi:hypothetical protein
MNLGIYNNAFSDYDKHTNTEVQTSNRVSQDTLRHTTHAYSTSSLYEHKSRYVSVDGFRNQTVLWIPKRWYKMRQRFHMDRILPNSLLTAILHWIIQNVRIWQTIIKYTHTHTHKEEQSMDLWSDVHRITCELWSRLMTNDTVRTVSPLYGLRHRSPIWIIIHTYVLCTSLHILQTIIHNFLYFIRNAIYLIIQPWILIKTVRYLNCDVIRAHFNYTCILVLTILKMATQVAETCWWPQWRKNTSIKSKRMCSSFNVFYSSNYCMKYRTQKPVQLVYTGIFDGMRFRLIPVSFHTGNTISEIHLTSL